MYTEGCEELIAVKHKRAPPGKEPAGEPDAGPMIATCNRNRLADKHQIGIDQGRDRRGKRKTRHDRRQKRGQDRQRGKGRGEGERRRG
ncbi:hypothetical protein RHGRI_012108 [Rhododendron griersonianum]|uniref:Uncharacterized protein n=1 Tax=Rhododendron griersonianum TaxID=479676 RepID=A0AAV6KPM8_9ERIC|nr:hypothetical protein RHGRI_012108 [Rhododendron griersonianum]